MLVTKALTQGHRLFDNTTLVDYKSLAGCGLSVKTSASTRGCPECKVFLFQLADIPT